MRLIIYVSLLVTLFSNQSFATFKNSTNFKSDVLSIEKYTLSIPDEFSEHTKGFIPGLGSSITIKKIINESHIQIYAQCDRGPNYTIAAPQDKQSTIIFPAPSFSPFIGIIDIEKGKSATLTDVITIKMDNQPITGIPTPSAQNKNPLLSIPADLNFKYIAPDIRGMDPESLDVDNEGNFWIGDEYGPRIIKANSSGDILDILSTENGLPEILKNGPVNRGFEALAITPNGKVYAAMESILDFDGQTKNTANFIRMIEFDPILNQTRTFAYSFDQNTYFNNLSVKIGELAAIDDTHFLIVEQGMTKDGMRNIVYCIDISNATDISNISLPKENISSSLNIQTIKKTKIFNPREYNWPHEKLEGLAILNENSIIITHDNDFGFSLSINDINSERVEDYTVDTTTQKLLRYAEKTEDKVKVNLDNNANTWIWIVTFEKPFLEITENQSSNKVKPISLKKNQEKNLPIPLFNKL